MRFGSFKKPKYLMGIPASTQTFTYFARYTAYACTQLTPLHSHACPSPLTPHSHPPISSLPFVFMYPGALHASAMNVSTPYFCACFATQTWPLSFPSHANADEADGCGEFM